MEGAGFTTSTAASRQRTIKMLHLLRHSVIHLYIQSVIFGHAYKYYTNEFFAQMMVLDQWIINGFINGSLDYKEYNDVVQ